MFDEDIEEDLIPRARVPEKFKKLYLKGINNFDQETAKEVCEYFGDMKEFGIWISLISRYGLTTFNSNFRSMKERGIRNPRYLLACFRKSGHPTK